MEDLWSSAIGKEIVTSPRTILDKQSTYLAARTSGLVEGRINTIDDDAFKKFYTSDLEGITRTEFIQSYSLLSPTLGYITRIFLVIHSITLYPCVIVIEDMELFEGFKPTGNYYTIDIKGEKGLICPDMETFTIALGDVLKLRGIAKIINSLIAQSTNS